MKATPDNWAHMEHWAVQDGNAACILELRARVESLEDDATQQSISNGFCFEALIKRIKKLEARQ